MGSCSKSVGEEMVKKNKIFILVVDFGTSKVKANLVDAEDGTFLTSCSRSYTIMTTAEGHTELELEQVWDSAVDCVRQVLGSVKEDGKIIALSFSYFGDNLILADENGDSLSQCILCFDSRGTDEAQYITEQLSEAKLVEVIGSPYSYMSTGAKILWMRRHMPDIFNKAKYFFSIQQFINRKLGLQAINDGTMAARKQLYDTGKGVWSRELLELIGIGEESLGEIKPTNTIIGEIDSFGPISLPYSIPVVLGGHDCDLGIVGLGVGSEENPVVADITGTYDHIGYLADGMINTKRTYPHGKIESYCGPLDNKSVCIGAFTTSGAVLEWFMREVNSDTSQDAYQFFWNHVVFDGNGTVCMCPDFSGNQGSFQGIGLGVGKNELFQSIIEALTFKTKEIIDDCERIKLGGINRVRIGGGAANSAEWIQLRANITGKIFEKMENIQVSALGTAIIAAYTMGIYGNISDAIQNMVSVSRVFLPDMEVHNKYNIIYKGIHSNK